MTSPQPDQQTQDQQDDQHTAEELAVLAALAAFFASVAAVSATLLPARLVSRLTALGLEPRAVNAAGRLAMAPPLTGRGRYGSPVHDGSATATTLRKVKAEEPWMRARYVLAAAKRLTRALVLAGKQAVAPAERTPAAKPEESLFVKAVRREAQYMDQQRAAGQNRARAAAALDQAAAQAGPDGKLRWNTRRDNRVSPDCAALEGRLFSPDDPPNGLIPGAVHPQCRCWATAATDMFSAVPTVSLS